MKMTEDPEAFWAFHVKMNKFNKDFFSSDFKQLFTALVQRDPQQRLTIDQIKNTNWFKGEVYSREELAELPLLKEYANARAKMDIKPPKK